ncbi:MAG: PQQ-binding-like beta-propeller repeat protein [Roseovarius sp.]|nr:PQQ-binding-like beta-propeller repeat protein [Roseovarius sp.]
MFFQYYGFSPGKLPMAFHCAFLKKALLTFFGLSALVFMTACDDDERILRGERESVRAIVSESENETTLSESVTLDGPAPPIFLSAATSNPNWPQSIGTPATRTRHPALGKAPRLIWSVSIGEGDGRRGRITADPVVANGLVYTLDSHARVSAVSTSGQLTWTRDLTPAGESSSEASGGGIAHGGGTLFVSTGFGVLSALDARTGNLLWEQKLGATGSGAPAISGDLLYLVTGDDLAWALETKTGRIKWQVSATPDIHNVMGAPAPAVSSKYAIFAFGSGEIISVFRRGGLRRWASQIAGQRESYSSGRVADITSDPVIQGDRVFIGSHSGRTVALGLETGKRLWTAPEGPLNTIWPAGDSIFLVSDRNELLRLSSADGTRQWVYQLPFFRKSKPKRQSEIYAHHGPVIAGGQLIVASGDETLRFFNPETGELTSQTSLPGGATTNPVVAGGLLYVVASNGNLLAFR